MAELEASTTDATLRFLAKMKRLSFSTMFAPLQALDDPDSLGEMQDYIMTTASSSSSSGGVDHKAQAGIVFAAKMFGTGTARLVHSELKLECDDDLKSKEYLTKRCATLGAAVKLKTFVGNLLEMILDLPARKHQQRSAALKSLQALMSSVKLCSGESALMLDVLLLDPYVEEFELVKKDASLISALAI